MSVEYFIRYQGKCYDVGTKLRFKTGIAEWASIMEGTIESIGSGTVYIRLLDGKMWQLSKYSNLEKLIMEIIEPVYYSMNKIVADNHSCPPEWDVETGWIWYLIIMAGGSIFNSRWILWIFSTLYFFAWKNGFFNGGNK